MQFQVREGGGPTRFRYLAHTKDGKSLFISSASISRQAVLQLAIQRHSILLVRGSQTNVSRTVVHWNEELFP